MVKENKVLVVVDMQNDFIDGALGTKEAQALVPRLAEYIQQWDGSIAFTRDTHGENYFDTLEGKKLPVKHCIKGTEGWQITDKLAGTIVGLYEPKNTFGSLDLPKDIQQFFGGVPESIEVCGLCTGICVLSNVAILRAAFPNTPITVNAKYTECVTPESKKTALEAMKMLQVDVIDEEATNKVVDTVYYKIEFGTHNYMDLGFVVYDKDEYDYFVKGLKRAGDRILPLSYPTGVDGCYNEVEESAKSWLEIFERASLISEKEYKMLKKHDSVISSDVAASTADGLSDALYDILNEDDGEDA